MGLIAACTVALLLIASGAPPSVAAADPQTLPRFGKHEVGIVFMHGRLGTPDYLAPLALSLRNEGYLVEIPVMPCARTRAFDSTVEGSMAELDAMAAGLRAKGARRVIVAGHSLGGAAALRYGATRENVDGLILIAASWNPASPGWQRIVGESLARAREAVAAGRDRETDSYQYVANDGRSATVVAQARGYFDFNRPDSPISLPTNARGFQRAVPVLWLSSSEDSRPSRDVAAGAFGSLPSHRYSRHDTITTSHSSAATAAIPEISAWLDRVRR